jgi:hypothetical protein
MEKIIKEWRKATPEEIKNGSPEMVLDREFSVEVEPENKEVELWKVKGILTIMGLCDSVDAALENLSEPNKTLAKLSWNNGNVIHSQSDTVKFVQSVLKLTDEQVDNIFNQAEAIKL